MDIIDTVLSTARAEFADLGHVEHMTRTCLRLLTAMLLGAAIGWERESRDAEAGLRTHMLVALGSAFFVIVPAEAGVPLPQRAIVIQGLLAGIGFLGAGAVLKNSAEGRIHGLTTAASIWATAAVGVAVGFGLQGTAVIATILILVVLALLRALPTQRSQRALPQRSPPTSRSQSGQPTSPAADDED